MQKEIKYQSKEIQLDYDLKHMINGQLKAHNSCTVNIVIISKVPKHTLNILKGT